MELSKIKAGATLAYASRANSGRGVVQQVYQGGRGCWVVLYDKVRDKMITVRPSQVSR